MKITTLNYKNDDYTDNHEIYVGTHTGSFKRINVTDENPFSQNNLQDLNTLTKDSRITALTFSDENCNEILIGRQNKCVQIYSTVSNCYESEQEFTECPIVGLARYDEKIIAGLATGKIEQHQEPKSIILTAGDNISRMRQCPTNKALIATGGKERQNCLKVFDLKEGKEIFRSKNLPNDFLQLEVPIWDSDIGFFDDNVITTCSRYGYVRVYDMRKQRRPILKYVAPEIEQWSFCSLITAKENYVYCGTTMGIAKAFDIRKFKNFVHTYKGFTGSVSDLCLDESGKNLISSCLDRYVRVHNTDSCVMLYQCYVKSKATRVVVKTLKNENKLDDYNELDEQNLESNGNGKIDSSSDEEYEALFENMEKISESNENEVQENESNENEVKLNKKRKGGDKKKKLKKKKI